MTNQYNMTYPVYYAECERCQWKNYSAVVYMLNESVSEALREWQFQMYKNKASAQLQRVREKYE